MVGVGAHRRDAVGTETGGAPETAGSSHSTLAVAVPCTSSGNVGKAAAAGVGLGGPERLRSSKSEGTPVTKAHRVQVDAQEGFAQLCRFVPDECMADRELGAHDLDHGGCQRGRSGCRTMIVVLSHSLGGNEATRIAAGVFTVETLL